jgi:hypothetical protein
MLRRILMVSALAALVVPMLHSPVLAHHSTAAYADQDLEQKGTVVEYDWGNPHVVVVWDVADNGGKTVRWTGELASVSSLLADGMTKSSLKPGDPILITIRPAKSGTPHSVIEQIKRGDGTMVLKWSRQAGGTPAERAARAAQQKADEAAAAGNGNQ